MFMNPCNRLSNLALRLSALLTLIVGVSILLATSPSDIPSVDAESSATLLEGEKSIDFQVSYRRGPVDFETFPLLVDFTIKHQEVSEDFLFEDQSWTLITEDLNGEQSRQQVALRRGNDELFIVNRDIPSLNGMISLLQCHSDGDYESLCIPCDVKEERCDFSISLVREGAPYPAEVIEISASQWAEEGADFTLDIKQR